MTPPAVNVSNPQSLNLEPNANSEGTSFRVDNMNAASDVGLTSWILAYWLLENL